MEEQLPYAIDRREDLKGPCIHALFIGVSAYDYLSGGAHEDDRASQLKLPQLETPAVTAAKLFDWLSRADRDKRLPYPLASATLLLSPSAGEKGDIARIVRADGWAYPSRANIEVAVRRLNKDILETEHRVQKAGKGEIPGIAVYYFGGHGVDTDRTDPIILPADFLNPELPLWSRAIRQSEIRGLLTQFAPTDRVGSGKAEERVRLFLVCDCCREDVSSLAPTEHISPDVFFDLLKAPPCYRDNQVLWAAAPRLAGSELTKLLPLFQSHLRPLTALGHLLLTCLEWANEEWANDEVGVSWRFRLSSSALAENVARAWRELVSFVTEHGDSLPGKPETNLSGPAFPICYGEAPSARIILRCAPPELSKTLSVSVLRNGNPEDESVAPWTIHPKPIRLPMGVFTVAARAASRLQFVRKVEVRPILSEWGWEFQNEKLEVCGPRT